MSNGTPMANNGFGNGMPMGGFGMPTGSFGS